MGTLQTINGRPVLRFERRLAQPPARVWKAITEPAEMAHWFPATVDTELKVGATMRFTFDDMPVEATEGEILELDPPKLFVFRWGQDVLRLDLIPEGSGCRLVFTHTLSGTGPMGDRRAAARHAGGWDGCLDLLLAHLAGQRAESGMDEWFERNERYVETFGLAEGELLDQADGHLVRFERDLVQPSEAVWAAMTRQTAVERAGRPPAPVTNPKVPAGEFAVVEPARALEYGWVHDDRPAGTVRWEITTHDFGCRLVVTQTLPRRLAMLCASVLAAWQVQLELFVASLHGQIRSWPADRVAELEKLYSDRLR